MNSVERNHALEEQTRQAGCLTLTSSPSPLSWLWQLVLLVSFCSRVWHPKNNLYLFYLWKTTCECFRSTCTWTDLSDRRHTIYFSMIYVERCKIANWHCNDVGIFNIRFCTALFSPHLHSWWKTKLCSSLEAMRTWIDKLVNFSSWHLIL